MYNQLVAVNSSSVCTEVSSLFVNSYILPPVTPFRDQMAFSRHYDGRPHTYIIAWKMQGGLADDLYLFSVYFHTAPANFSLFLMKWRFNTTVVGKLLTNHKWVVTWQLLDTVCPVLLMMGGNPQKGLAAQRLSTVRQFVQSLFVIKYVRIWTISTATAIIMFPLSLLILNAQHNWQ